MTVATYTSDLSDIFLFETTAGVSATGGGGAGLSAGIDFAMEGTYAVDKQVSNAIKGMMYDNSTNFTIGSDDHFFLWITVATPGICTLIHVYIGDDTSNFVNFQKIAAMYGPSGITEDAYPDLSGECYAVRFNNVSSEGDGGLFLTGSPSANPSWIGAGIRTNVSKGPNFACDAARLGTGYDILHGTGADPEANFAGIAADDATTSEGILLPIGGGYRQLGKLRIGSASTACEFLDSNLFIGAKVTAHCLDDFTEILIEHADSIVTLKNVTFKGLWTQNRGRFEVLTSAAEVNLTGCVFLLAGDTVLGSGSTCLGCSWIHCDTVTANGADMTGSVMTNYEEAANTSPLIWDVATDPDGLLDDMSFKMGTEATHAIEFGTTSPLTMTIRGIDFSGYNASNGQNDSVLHIKRTSGTVTINVIGGSGTVSYRTEGAVVVIVQNPVTLSLHVISQSTGSDVSGARVLVVADTGGPLPYQDSVTITRVTTVASVAHTAHGLSNGEKVSIEGANQSEYNGRHTISNVSSNAYDYTVSGTPTTPATGTILSTAVIIDGTSDSGGLISDTRSYSSDQPIVGRVRDSSSSPFYKTSLITGSIDKDNGISILVQMVGDE